jgi:heme-degrading monooxygenase HmoA
MIGRLWSGRTEPANADAYEAFLRDDLLPEVAELEGARGAYVLRRETLDGAVEFVTLTLFESIDAVRRFAGEDEDAAVIEPRARELLAEYDPTVRHFEVVVPAADGSSSSGTT